MTVNSDTLIMSKIDLDFSNTEIAFAHKNDKDLKQAEQLFKLMSHNRLVAALSQIGLFALKLKLPFVKMTIRKTMFKQFCGGEQLSDCQSAINTLKNNHSLTILDYGAEAKSGLYELEAVKAETIRAIKFAAKNKGSVPVVSTKFTGLIDNDLLIKLQLGTPLDKDEESRYQQFKERAHEIANTAFENGISLFVDAEETWIQEPIDLLVKELMQKYNTKMPIIYNTYQMYIKSKLEQLKSDHQYAVDNNFIFGAKLVRGAYMEKERERASEMNYPSPICNNKQDTDYSYNSGIEYVVKHYKTCGSCNASHNEYSNLLQATLIHDMGVNKNHSHLNFCQLYGMSDHITFNLGKAGYNAAKYVPYGSVSDVFQYLIRRAQENKSMSGDMGKELKNISNERKRRRAKASK